MRFKTALLLASAFSVLATPALAIPVLFGGANAPDASGAAITDVAPGQTVTVTGPVLQLRLADGSTVIAPQGASFTVSSETPVSITLVSGSLRVNSAGTPVTVTRGGTAITTSSGAFSAAAQGAGLAGRVNQGTAQVAGGGEVRNFSAGAGYVASTSGGISGTFAPPVASAPSASGQATPPGPNAFSAADPRTSSGAGQTVVAAAQSSGFPVSSGGSNGGGAGTNGANTGSAGTGSTGGGSTPGGTAVQGSTLASYGGTPPVRGTVALAGTEKAGQIITYAGDWVGLDLRDNTTVTVGSNGELNGYKASADEYPERNTNDSLDRATVGGISIERWSGGVTGGRYYVSPNTERTSQQGLHLAYGAPAPAVPAQGLAIYKLAAATKPTLGWGGTAPGTMTSGEMGILFSVKPKLGFDFSVSMPGDAVYNVKTPGGAAAPSYAIELAALNKRGFYTHSLPTTGTGQACAGSCTSAVYGIIGGSNGETVGLSYEIGPISSNDAAGRRNTVTGAAIFTQDSFDASKGAVAVNPPISSGAVSEPLRGTVNMGTVYVTPGQNGNWSMMPSLIRVDHNGVVSSFIASQNYERNDAVIADLAGNRYVQIGRWNGGTIKRGGADYFSPDGWQGMTYVAGTAISTFRLPTTGIGTYDLKSSVAPVLNDGSTAPGSFTGRMGVDFSTAATGTVKVGIDGLVTVNSTPSTTLVYDIGTTGGAANPATSQVSYNSNITGIYNVAAPSGDVVCGSPTCSVSVGGMLSGPGGREAALGYQIRGNDKAISGAALFERTDDPSLRNKELAQAGVINGPGVTLPSGGYGTVNLNNSSNAVTVYTAGRAGIQTIEANNQRYGADTAQVVDSGSAGSMTWSRWTNGTLNQIFTEAVPNMGSNQSTHVLVGEPASNIPTTGTAQYTLAGHTAPTSTDNAVAPGTLTGAMAIQFGSSQANTGVGVDLNVAIGGHTYNIQTAGGTANPGSSHMKLNGATFGGNNMDIAAGGPACPTAGCKVAMGGFLSGNGGAGAGLHYTISTFGSPNNAGAVQGVAAFTKSP